MKIELTDADLTIRPYTLADAEYHLTQEDEEIEKWLSGGKSTLESVQYWIQMNQEYWNQDGPVYNFAITQKGVLIGMVEANFDKEKIMELEEGDVNISYALFPQARGKGYATKAVELMLEFLATKGFKRAIIRVEPENMASHGIPNKLNFIQLQYLYDEPKKFIAYARALNHKN